MLKQISPLPPLNFFQFTMEIAEGKVVKLPDLTPFLDEESFAKFSISWTKSGLNFHLEVDKPLEEVFFPEVLRGDSLEIFLDTRDMKSAKSIHRFCHHFVFLPEEIEGIRASEVTRFRAEESRPHADPNKLHVKTTLKKKSYIMEIEIEKEALYGFEPNTFDRLGFTFRLNRLGGDPQHFSVSSKAFNIEQNPNLWGSITLKKGKK